MTMTSMIIMRGPHSGNGMPLSKSERFFLLWVAIPFVAICILGSLALVGSMFIGKTPMTIEPIKAHFLGTTLNDLTVPDCLLVLEYLVGDGKTDDPEYLAERRRLIEAHFAAFTKPTPVIG